MAPRLEFAEEEYRKAYPAFWALPEFQALGWRAQGLHSLLWCRFVGRYTGELEIGKMEPALALAVLLGEKSAVAEIREALAELMAGEDPFVVIVGPRLVLPDYLAAQEASQSDAARARQYRAKVRAEKAAAGDAGDTSRDGAVTKRDAAITSHHVPSRHVTTNETNDEDPEETDSAGAGVGGVRPQPVTPGLAHFMALVSRSERCGLMPDSAVAKVLQEKATAEARAVGADPVKYAEAICDAYDAYRASFEDTRMQPDWTDGGLRKHWARLTRIVAGKEPMPKPAGAPGTAAGARRRSDAPPTAATVVRGHKQTSEDTEFLRRLAAAERSKAKASAGATP